MDSNTTKVKWVFWEIFGAFGFGSLITCTLPAIQSSLPEADVATATGTHAFLRSLGLVWGITIPSIVLDNRINGNLGQIQDANVRAVLSSGGAYSQINSDFILSLDNTTRMQVVELYTDALQTIWRVGIAFSLVGFLAVFIEKHIEMRQTLETDFGIDTGKKNGVKNAENGDSTINTRTL